MIFVDTSFLYPLFCAEDSDHERVRETLEGYRGRSPRDLFLTTNHVIGETITLVRMRPPKRHDAAVKLGERLYAEALARVYWATPEDERAAFEYFCTHQDKEYSFVDCLSFAVMEKLGIHEALAIDEDFTHQFIAHPGPVR